VIWWRSVLTASIRGILELCSTKQWRPPLQLGHDRKPQTSLGGHKSWSAWETFQRLLGLSLREASCPWTKKLLAMPLQPFCNLADRNHPKAEESFPSREEATYHHPATLRIVLSSASVRFWGQTELL
jgi:hypothetical protein